MRLRLLGALVTVLIATAAVDARAETVGLDFTGGVPGGPTTPSPLTLGYKFEAIQNVNVTGLATWNNWKSEPGTVQVGLWDDGGTLLASAIVSSTDPTIGTATWSYVAISPVSLFAGEDYYVGSFGAAANYTFNPGLTFSVSPEIKWLASAFSDSADFEFPTSSHGTGVNGYYGGNVVLDATAPVPELSTWAMMILGFFGIGYMAYRRRTQVVAA